LCYYLLVSFFYTMFSQFISFPFFCSDLYFHCDESFMPHNTLAWSARNFLGTTSRGVCVTYWLNILQVPLVWLFLLCMMEMINEYIYIVFPMKWKY
jgi:hypothetical protein